MRNAFNSKKSPVVVLMSAILVSGCGTAIKPEDLPIPTQVTCLNLKEPLSHTGKYGLVNVPYTTRLERGPYVSEREDEKGTYYRAPPGGLSIKGAEGPAFATKDGGIYIPKDPNEPPRLYEYFSTTSAPVHVPAEGADCSRVGYVKDPSTAKVSLVSFAADGAAGGAAGAIMGRNPQSSMSTGQTAGAGAVGGLAAGLIGAAIINADVGKIVPPALPIQDAQFLEQLRKLAASRVPVRELPFSAVPSDAKTTAPTH